MAHSRDAIDTLRGYYYQFDYYILQLLTAVNDADVITLEGIEDVDIQTASGTTAVQCKYYEGTDYNHSKIAQPIRFMLKGYVNHPGTPLKYKLYGYYHSGTNKLAQPITLDFLKTHLLTYTAAKVKHEFHVDEGINDTQLTDFLNHLEIDINAKSFSQQEKEIEDAIKAVFNIRSRVEQQVEYFYNRSLGIVRNICIEGDAAKRKLSKGEFIEKLKQEASDTFDAWYAVKKGKAEYCKLMRSRYFNSYNLSPQKRFFLIDSHGASVPQIVKVIKRIKEKYSKFGPRETKPFCPFIYLDGISDAVRNIVLKALIEDHIIVKDGYDYKDADFNAQSLASSIQQDQRVDIKYLHTIDEMNQVMALLRGTKEVYQFYVDSCFYDSAEKSDIKINISEIGDINSIV